MSDPEPPQDNWDYINDRPFLKKCSDGFPVQPVSAAEINRALDLSRNEQFHKDFTAAFAQLNALAAQYGLPAPVVVFPYEWKSVIMQRLSSPQEMQFKYLGINFRFGQFRDNQTTFERF